LGWTKVLLLGLPQDLGRVQTLEKMADELLKKYKLDTSLRFTLFSLLDGASLLEQEQLNCACTEVSGKKMEFMVMLDAAILVG